MPLVLTLGTPDLSNPISKIQSVSNGESSSVEGGETWGFGNGKSGEMEE